MGLFRFILKKVVPIPKILNYQSYAFVGPHPDDIEIACGPTVARLSAMGKRICFIIATDGRYGTQDPNLSCEDIILTRKQEAINSAKVLGVDDVRFLDFSDGGNYRVEDLKDKIAIELARFKPDLIFNCDNSVKSELHPDHIKAGRATEIAMLYCTFPLMMKDLGINEIAQPKGIAYYYTDKPNSYVKVSKYYSKRAEALQQHNSQFLIDDESKKLYKLMLLYFNFQSRRYGLRRFCKHADAYRVLNVAHTHCAPDASDM